MEQEYFGWNQKGDERDLSRMSDKKHLVNGRFSVSAKIQDNEVTGQTARRAVDVHTNCVRSTTTSESADFVVNCGTADEVRGSCDQQRHDGRAATAEHADGLPACGESQ